MLRLAVVAKRALLVLVAARGSMAWRGPLVARKEAWLAESAASVVVVGNSGGDLDSVVSALATAHLVEGVALAAFKQSELTLRRDAVLALKHYGVPAREDGSIDELAYADDPTPTRSWRAVLVDHNAFEGMSWNVRQVSVVGILDHHADEGAHARAELFRVVDPACGSAATLVAERLLAASEAIEADLVGLLVSTIALDTRGFDPAQKRFSARDVAVVGELLDRLGSPPAADLRDRRVPDGLAPTVAGVATALLDARADVADLTAAQLLRMDFKQALLDDGLALGVASVLATLDDLTTRATERDRLTLGALLSDLTIEKRLDVLFALTKPSKHRPPSADDDAPAPRDDGEKRKALLYFAHPPTPLNPNVDVAALERKLVALPAELPPSLAALPLFQTQEIATLGLGASFRVLPGHSPVENDSVIPLRYSLIRREITRKTILPILLSFCESLRRQQRPPRGYPSSS